MKKLWLVLGDRFDALKPRERLVVFLGLTALLVAIFYWASFGPLLQRNTAASLQIQQSETTLTALRQQEIALFVANSRDPDAEAIKLLQDMQADNAKLRLQLTSAQAQLASPEKMTGVLRDLIASQKGLELVSMRAQAASDLLAGQASAPASRALRSIFKHGIEITVRGDYASLAAYVRQVENLPWKIYRDGMVLKSETYPVSTLTLTLYTLSMERAWLSF